MAGSHLSRMRPCLRDGGAWQQDLRDFYRFTCGYEIADQMELCHDCGEY